MGPQLTLQAIWGNIGSQAMTCVISAQCNRHMIKFIVVHDGNAVRGRPIQGHHNSPSMPDGNQLAGHCKISSSDSLAVSTDYQLHNPVL